MRSRARAIGEEFGTAEEQTESLNLSLERSAMRTQHARNIAMEMYARDDEVQIYDDAEVRYVDAGYWVSAQIFVDAEVVEDALGVTQDASSIEADPMAAQRRGE